MKEDLEMNPDSEKSIHRENTLSTLRIIHILTEKQQELRVYIDICDLSVFISLLYIE